MEVIIQNTKADFVKFFRSYFFQKFKKPFSILLCIFLLICIHNMMVSLTRQFSLWQIAVIEILVIITILSLFYFLFLQIFSLRLNKLILIDNSLLENKKLSLTESGINMESSSKKIILKWENIISVTKYNEFMYLKTSNNKSELIPIRFFKQKSDAEIFYRHIQSKILKR